MKLSRKVLAALSASALLLTAGIFTSCSEEDDDDEAGAISGSNNNYALSYDNTASSDNYRCYNTTLNKHRGALCQITLKDDGDLDGAAMGYMWDLYSTDASASAEDVARTVSESPRTFCIVGFNYNHTISGKVAYYVSRYTNVYDIQASNFGTSGVTVNGATQTAVETEYLELNATNSFTPTVDSDGNVVVTVNVYEDTDDSGNYTGAYNIDIYNGAISKDELETATPADSTTISAADLGYTSSTTHAVAQHQGAVYANVYAGKNAVGTWKYADTYSADEVVEE